MVSKINSQLAHRSNDGHQTLDDVAVDNGPILLAFFFGISSFMNYLHLLDYCALPRLSRSCEKED